MEPELLYWFQFYQHSLVLKLCRLLYQSSLYQSQYFLLLLPRSRNRHKWLNNFHPQIDLQIHQNPSQVERYFLQEQFDLGEHQDYLKNHRYLLYLSSLRLVSYLHPLFCICRSLRLEKFGV